MKITDVIARQLRIPNVENIFDGTQDVLIVEVRTDTGVSGLGEIVSSSYVARSVIEAPRSGGGRHGLREIVRGMDPMDTESVWDAMREGTAWYGRRGVAVHAMAGVDVALWDLKARALGFPVYRALDHHLQEPHPVKAYASVLWGDTVNETRALAESLCAQGFQAIKFGFGSIGTSLQHDLAMVGAARDVAGRERDLMVDVGRRWTVDEAIQRGNAMAKFGVRWIEEPLHPDDLEGYARVAAAVPVPIAAAETEETVPQFEAFLQAGVKVVQPDLGRVGLTQGMKISALAKRYGAECVPHCFGTGINTAASIHWMVAAGGDLVEYPMRANALCRNLASGMPGLDENGLVRPRTEPGLGVELNDGIVREHLYV
ncbi:MAG TPA: mandelate racemase/muconate lactonizing enzyme family protein [Vicinamibacterales bacterium]|nr:mandelate racemase/muconate lactonizing enzyme family protein [Vicinamibacterales bacterium]